MKINRNADSLLRGMIEARQVGVSGKALPVAGNGPSSAGLSIAPVE